MNKWTLSKLRATAEQIDEINKESPVYAELCSFLNECSDDALEIIRSADIKWVSVLASTRLMKLAA